MVAGVCDMPCYHPIRGFQRVGGGTLLMHEVKDSRPLTVPCGYCIGCKLDRSKMWSVRCVHEAMMHSCNSFVTLTYDDEHHSSLNPPGALCYGHFQRFIRRVRKARGPFRYFAAGEYGEQSKRPHFHALLFGLDFPDMAYHKKSGKEKLYISKELDALWSHGFCTIGAVTLESAGYIARYTMKKRSVGDDCYKRVNLETGEVYEVPPEMLRMSLKPGIGAKWFEKYGMSDCATWDKIVFPGGYEINPPRYYSTLLQRSDPYLHDWNKFQRVERVTDKMREDSTDERLAVREVVESARLSFKRKVL